MRDAVFCEQGEEVAFLFFRNKQQPAISTEGYGFQRGVAQQFFSEFQLGGSGIFRPEVTASLGVNVPVRMGYRH